MGVVELLYIFQSSLIIIRNEINGYSFTAETTTATNSVTSSKIYDFANEDHSKKKKKIPTPRLLLPVKKII